MAYPESWQGHRPNLIGASSDPIPQQPRLQRVPSGAQHRDSSGYISPDSSQANGRPSVDPYGQGGYPSLFRSESWSTREGRPPAGGHEAVPKTWGAGGLYYAGSAAYPPEGHYPPSLSPPLPHSQSFQGGMSNFGLPPPHASPHGRAFDAPPPLPPPPPSSSSYNHIPPSSSATGLYWNEAPVSPESYTKESSPILPLLRNQSLFRVPTPSSGWGSGAVNGSPSGQAPVGFGHRPDQFGIPRSSSMRSARPPPLPPPPVPPPPLPPHPSSEEISSALESSAAEARSGDLHSTLDTSEQYDMQLSDLTRQLSQRSIGEEGEQLPAFRDDTAPPRYTRSHASSSNDASDLSTSVTSDRKGKGREAYTDDTRSTIASHSDFGTLSSHRSTAGLSQEASDHELAVRLSREDEGDPPDRNSQFWAPFDAVLGCDEEKRLLAEQDRELALSMSREEEDSSAIAEKRALMERDLELALSLSREEAESSGREPAQVVDESDEQQRHAEAEQDREVALMLEEDEKKRKQEKEDEEWARMLADEMAAEVHAQELSQVELQRRRQEDADAQFARELALGPGTPTQRQFERALDGPTDEKVPSEELAVDDSDHDAFVRPDERPHSSNSVDPAEDIVPLYASLGPDDESSAMEQGDDRPAVGEDGWQVYEAQQLRSHILPSHVNTGSVHTQIYVSPPPPSFMATSPVVVAEDRASPAPTPPLLSPSDSRASLVSASNSDHSMTSSGLADESGSNPDWVPSPAYQALELPPDDHVSLAAAPSPNGAAAPHHARPSHVQVSPPLVDLPLYPNFPQRSLLTGYFDTAVPSSHPLADSAPSESLSRSSTRSGLASSRSDGQPSHSLQYQAPSSPVVDLPQYDHIHHRAFSASRAGAEPSSQSPIQPSPGEALSRSSTRSRIVPVEDRVSNFSDAESLRSGTVSRDSLPNAASPFVRSGSPSPSPQRQPSPAYDAHSPSRTTPVVSPGPDSAALSGHHRQPAHLPGAIISVDTAPPEPSGSAFVPVTASPGPEDVQPSTLTSGGVHAGPRCLPGISIGLSAPGQEQTYHQSNPEATLFPDLILLHADSPLFISAPTFRALLRALAHFGTVRVEAPPSLIATVKASVQTNAVVQFTRAHANATDWRCILHLEVHPSQTAVGGRPGGPRARSRIPAQPGPLSTVVPLPTPAPALPISLAALADYLGRALSDSRSVPDSNAAKKLHRAVMQSDPDEAVSPVPARPGILSRFGFGGRTATRTDLNEDTYDLVTPFILSDVT